MEKLASYVVTKDAGFAPNPFWGYCTVAACTPNHQRLALGEGDWIVGYGSKERNHELVYAMCVSAVLEFDEYYDDPRFQTKKPRRNGTWQERCGDNIYFMGEDGEYKQAFTYYHVGPEYLKNDTRRRGRSQERPRVFVSDHFFYFGEKAPLIPEEYKSESLFPGGRGCRYARDLELAQKFVQWLESEFPLGVAGLPRDRDKSVDESCDVVPRGCAPGAPEPRRSKKRC